LKYYGYENYESFNESKVDVCTVPVLKYSRTLSKQASLPRMPVPSLSSTINKYLIAIRHLLNESEYEYTKKIADEFMDGLGQQLQNFLVERSKKTENWVYYI
jgi:hypothetical protein